MELVSEITTIIVICSTNVWTQNCAFDSALYMIIIKIDVNSDSLRRKSTFCVFFCSGNVVTPLNHSKFLKKHASVNLIFFDEKEQHIGV